MKGIYFKQAVFVQSQSRKHNEWQALRLRNIHLHYGNIYFIDMLLYAVEWLKITLIFELSVCELIIAVTCNIWIPGSIPTNSKCCFLEQETLSTLLRTGFYPGKKRVTWKISTRLLNVLPSINKVDYYYYYYYYYYYLTDFKRNDLWEQHAHACTHKCTHTRTENS